MAVIKYANINERFAEYEEKELWKWLIEYCQKHDYWMAISALYYARGAHALHKRKDKQAFITHPMHVARYVIDAFSMTGMTAPEIYIGVSFLHDVCEESGISPEELPFPQEWQQKVALLTLNYSGVERIREKMRVKMLYFKNVSDDIVTEHIKIMDRLHNMKTPLKMGIGKNIYESRDHLLRYAKEAIERFEGMECINPLKYSYWVLNDRVNELERIFADEVNDFVEELERDEVYRGGVYAQHRKERKAMHDLDVHHLHWPSVRYKRQTCDYAASNLRCKYAVIIDIDIHQMLHAQPYLRSWDEIDEGALPSKEALEKLWEKCEPDTNEIVKWGINGCATEMIAHLLGKIREVERDNPKLKKEFADLKKNLETQKRFFREYVGEV